MLLTQDFEQRAPVPITFFCFEKVYSCNLQCVYVIFFFCKTRNEKEKGKKVDIWRNGWMDGGGRILVLYGVKLPWCIFNRGALTFSGWNGLDLYTRGRSFKEIQKPLYTPGHTATKILLMYSQKRNCDGLSPSLQIHCVCERFIYSQDRATCIFLQQNRQTDRRNL